MTGEVLWYRLSNWLRDCLRVSGSRLVLYGFFVSIIFTQIGAALAQGSSGLAKDSIKTITLEECIKIASTKSTEFLKGTNAVELAGTDVLRSYGQFLPDLALGTGYNYTSGTNYYTMSVPTLVDTRKTGYYYQLATSLNLFNGLADKASLKAALMEKSGQVMNLQRALQQICFDVTQSYLQVILDRKIVGYASENLETSLKREDQLKVLTEIGRKVKSDLYQQQAQTSADKLTLIHAETQLRTDKINLFKKLRMADAERYELAEMTLNEDPLGPSYSNEQSLIDTALTLRSDLRSDKLNVDIAEQNIEKYRSGYLPKLAINYGLYSEGGYYYQLYVNDLYSLPPSQPSFGNQLGQLYGMGGLEATWTIFDKWYTRSNISAGKITMDNARIDYENLQIEIKTDIKKAMGDYQAALQAVESAEKGIVAATSAFDIINGRYELGSSDFIELINAQLALLQARENKIQAIIGLVLQKRVIDFYIGK